MQAEEFNALADRLVAPAVFDAVPDDTAAQDMLSRASAALREAAKLAVMVEDVHKRELHHFETEDECADLKRRLAQAEATIAKLVSTAERFQIGDEVTRELRPIRAAHNAEGGKSDETD